MEKHINNVAVISEPFGSNLSCKNAKHSPVASSFFFRADTDQ